MSKERARRREARQREAAIVAAARAAEAERRERRQAQRRVLSTRLRPRRPRPGGILAERRRRQTGATVALLVGANVLVFLIFPEWPVRAMALCVSLLGAPVLHTLLFRR